MSCLLLYPHPLHYGLQHAVLVTEICPLWNACNFHMLENTQHFAGNGTWEENGSWQKNVSRSKFPQEWLTFPHVLVSAAGTLQCDYQQGTQCLLQNLEFTAATVGTMAPLEKLWQGGGKHNVLLFLLWRQRDGITIGVCVGIKTATTWWAGAVQWVIWLGFSHRGWTDLKFFLHNLTVIWWCGCDRWLVHEQRALNLDTSGLDGCVRKIYLYI